MAHDDDRTNLPTYIHTGVSFKTLSLYGLVFFFRLTSIIPFSGYLPYDKYVSTYIISIIHIQTLSV